MTSKMDQLIMEMDRDVEFWQRCSNLLKLLNDAKQRQDILEYKSLHKLLTGQEVEIYTDPSGERLIPKDHDPNKEHPYSSRVRGPIITTGVYIRWPRVSV